MTELSRAFKLIHASWKYRGFIMGSVMREFQSKYRNSILGAAWTVLNPLAMIVVYTVIFSQIMMAKLPGMDSAFSYSIYLCAGIITWGFFAEIIERGKNVFIENANLLTKLNFPRICLPAITILSASLNFSIIFGIFLGFLVISDNFPGIAVLAVIPLLLVQLIFAIGLGMILGVLNVFFRDVGQFFGIVLQFWFWLTPIVYPANILPPIVRHHLLLWNPMAPVIGAYQSIFVSSQLPVWNTLITPLLTGAVLCIVGMQLFRKHSGEMVDEL